jgi:hypothetical protein
MLTKLDLSGLSSLTDPEVLNALTFATENKLTPAAHETLTTAAALSRTSGSLQLGTA